MFFCHDYKVACDIFLVTYLPSLLPLTLHPVSLLTLSPPLGLLCCWFGQGVGGYKACYALLVSCFDPVF